MSVVKKQLQVSNSKGDISEKIPLEDAIEDVHVPEDASSEESSIKTLFYKSTSFSPDRKQVYVSNIHKNQCGI